MDVAEIVGHGDERGRPRHGMATLTERADEVRDAVQINSEITARAVKGALHSKLSAFKEHQFESRRAAAPERLSPHAQDRLGRHDAKCSSPSANRTACRWC